MACDFSKSSNVECVKPPLERSAQCREKGRDMIQEDADKMQSMVWEKAGKECDLRMLVEAKEKSVYADREACLLAAWQRNISISPIVSNNEPIWKILVVTYAR